MIHSLELWLKLAKKKHSHVNRNIDPVLLVPGLGGSILDAATDDGRKERVWVRLFGADHEFRTKLWSRYNLSTGKTVSLDPKTRIVVPEGRYGLFAIDTLDPDMIIGHDCVYYFHDMISEMIKWGFKEGETLFGFGYDFRQSNRLPETMDHFHTKLESVYTASGCKKVTIITHSMGGLLVKCFMALHTDVFAKYVKCWIAVAAPFRGAPGYITTSLLNGVSFVDGWEKNFFISEWNMHQLLLECPSIYELMGSPDYEWHATPLLQIWREQHDNTGESEVILESYQPAEKIAILKEALSSNMVNYDGEEMPLPLNLDILKWACETQKILSSAQVPATVKFYNIYGTSYCTPHTTCYGSEQKPISDLQALLVCKAKYTCVDGDGTVPLESAKADGLHAEARVGVPANHRGILCNHHVFRIVKHWLKVDSDPYYNPINDYVILPTAYESVKNRSSHFEVAASEEDWVVISDEIIENQSELASFLGAIPVSCVTKNLQNEAHVMIGTCFQGEALQEMEAVGVSLAVGS